MTWQRRVSVREVKPEPDHMQCAPSHTYREGPLRFRGPAPALPGCQHLERLILFSLWETTEMKRRRQRDLAARPA